MKKKRGDTKNSKRAGRGAESAGKARARVASRTKKSAARRRTGGVAKASGARKATGVRKAAGARKTGGAHRPGGGKREARPAPDVELEAAVFRRLVAHFDARKDVQNIELMILAGFCRNCLSKWLVEAAAERGLEFDLERAREKVYGMPYAEWKERHQQPATDEQLRRFETAEKAATKSAGQ